MRIRKKARPFPAVWLMTDERLGEGLLPAVARVPRGGGVVFRHHSLAAAARREVAQRVASLCRRRRLLLVIAAPPVGIRAGGMHLSSTARRRPKSRPPLLTAAAHNGREAARAKRLGARLLFVSPVFETRSHPGRTAMGPIRFGLLARRLPLPAIALGGMNPARFERLRPLGACGFAAIDHFAGKAAAAPPEPQKASAPPT